MMANTLKKDRIADLNYCCSSFLAFRYIERDNVDFSEFVKHKSYKSMLPKYNESILIRDATDIDKELNKIFKKISNKKLGILLSGGMDSACLASYMPEGSLAYTFRFLNGEYAKDELERAKEFAINCKLDLRYVDIDFDKIKNCVNIVMNTKCAPVHSIEPQLYIAAEQAKSDGVELLIYGDAADYVFYGMDGLLSKDWFFDDFYKRVIYIDPYEVLKAPVDMHYAFENYRLPNNRIDFLGFYDNIITEESYMSYYNAFTSACIDFLDPYECMKMANPVDLKRIRNGESKYLIRELFKMRYPCFDIPEKNPMPRPVDIYFKDYKPSHTIFNNNINIDSYSGNQKWLMWCLELFLNNFIDKEPVHV